MSTVLTQQSPPEALAPAATAPREVRLYSHSPIFYWWPVWAVGFVFALMTWAQGVPFLFTGPDGAEYAVKIHPNKSLGVVFTFVFFLVIVITHFSVRGTSSLTFVAVAVALALFLAYMRWWEPILTALGELAIFMNLGFYVMFSAALFVVWASAVLFFDRFTYWEFRPGQMIYHSVLGDGEHAFDTHGMSVDKLQADLFRHYILGLGTGDVHIVTSGAKRAEYTVKNVLFVGAKLAAIQQLIALKPDQPAEQVVTAGGPA